MGGRQAAEYKTTKIWTYQSHWMFSRNHVDYGTQTSSSPKECLLLGPGRWANLGDWFAFVDTKINLVKRCILPSKAALASSSCSNLDCSLTWPSSSFSCQNISVIKFVLCRGPYKKTIYRKFETTLRGCLYSKSNEWLVINRIYLVFHDVIIFLPSSIRSTRSFS